jgi:Zn-dependent M16 (insulinase) family peptidase
MMAKMIKKISKILPPNSLNAQFVPSAVSQLKIRVGKSVKIAKVYKARGCFMQKKYIVRLTEEERCQLREVIKKLKSSSQKVRRAQILLKADIEGSNWTDERIAEAFDCRTKTVEEIRTPLPTIAKHGKRVDDEYERAVEKQCPLV